MSTKVTKLLLLLLFLAANTVHAADLGNKTGNMWAPYKEWSISNPTYSGNPFDLIASVTFTHTNSGEKARNGNVL